MTLVRVGKGAESEAHDVVTAVHVGDLTRDGAGKIACEEKREAAYFQLIDVAVERGSVGVGFHHHAQVAYAARGQRLDRTSRNAVDADVFRAEIPGEVANGGFQSGLGNGHHVVVGNDLLRCVIAEGHDAAAVGHQ